MQRARSKAADVVAQDVDSRTHARDEAFMSSKSVPPLSGSAFRWPRRIRRILLATCLLLTAAVIGGLPVYVRPQVDQLRYADAILILGGPGDQRYPFGVDLGVEGWAPSVVVSNPKPDHPRLTSYCATPHAGFKLYCFAPDPETTKGEARELRRLASQYGWRTIIVVTSRPHISRARFILQQCFDGNLVMVASPAHMSAAGWAYQYVYQTAGYLRAALQPGC